MVTDSSKTVLEHRFFLKFKDGKSDPVFDPDYYVTGNKQKR
jgi:hypothetical protein